MPRLPPLPRLEWSEEGAPRAADFGDVYFSDAGGLAESEHVFLEGTGLPDAWRDRARFAICELGFGSGLNVLAAWRVWKATREPHATLHISSIEAFPLARDDAARALARFPDVADLAEALLARWPVRTYAPQRIWFEQDRFALTLFIGEAEHVLAGMRGSFDAWFLDGFAPSRNPAMWTPEILSHVARLSAPRARAATFSVAGDVRRGLEAVGFEVEKKPGYGGKRERLEARLRQASPLEALTKSAEGGRAGSSAEAPSARHTNAPHPPTAAPQGGGGVSIYPYRAAHPKRVAIIGAGIAGAACAQALVRRGVETIVLEAGRELGAGASGNPAGLVMPRLDRGPLGELFLAAYLNAVATYETLGAFSACGVEQRAEAGKAVTLFQQLNDPPLPEDWLVKLADDVALHPRAGLVRPRAAIEAMLRGAQVQFEAEVQSLDRSGEGWVLRAEDGRAMLKADAVVLACGAALARFEPASFLPITLSRGQIEWGEGPAPQRALVRSNYVAPFEGGVLFGATFDSVEDASEASELQEARVRNIAALDELAPEIAASIDPARLHSRASLRATTPDRVPIAGLLPDAPAWLAQYAALAHGRKIETDSSPPAHDGVYVIGGLGARGFTFAPLLGERIASEICGEPAPLSQFSLDAIHPARFLHRALKRH